MFHKIKSTTPDGELVKITFKLYENYKCRDIIFIKKRILRRKDNPQLKHSISTTGGFNLIYMYKDYCLIEQIYTISLSTFNEIYKIVNNVH